MRGQLVLLYCLLLCPYWLQTSISYCQGAVIESPDKITIAEVEVEGLERTNLEWLLDYSGLRCPCLLSKEQLEGIAKKLRTTQVFQSVELLSVVRATDGRTILRVLLVEKWTFIPVVRGAFGGGTPLLVAGAYDTHAFGKLLTLGGELRRYGQADPGGVAWIRAPRWRDGRHYANVELWQDNRIRAFYDKNLKRTGSLTSKSQQVIAESLLPLSSDEKTPWQLGIKFAYRRLKYLSWEGASLDSPTPFPLTRESKVRVLAKTVYDTLSVDGIQLEGVRTIASIGLDVDQSSTAANLEHELFAFYLFQENWNLSWHHWVGMSDDKSYQGTIFLGGLDSIRGLPDGYLYGTRAIYGNMELRQLCYKAKFAWIQLAQYIDIGMTTRPYAQETSQRALTAGLGVRLSVPQVNRLVFRVDFARSLLDPQTPSFSLGMNQFIDPYRPL